METIENKDWIVELATKIKTIETKWKFETLQRYRECGLEIINDPHYQKGEWDQARIRFSELTGYQSATIKRMIQLGNLSDVEFNNALDSYENLYSWVTRQRSFPKPSGLKKLAFNQDLVRLILDGKKTQTIRGKAFGFKKGEEVEGTCNSFATLIIDGVTKKSLADISDEDAKLDGFSNLLELKKYWKPHFGPWVDSKIVYLYRFKVKQEV